MITILKLNTQTLIVQTKKKLVPGGVKLKLGEKRSHYRTKKIKN